ncbi:hypothetical protein L7F22_021724, partial [Adiantum nelumboides]|nr:hypothetical protein [Adiantum nelumboides]
MSPFSFGFDTCLDSVVSTLVNLCLVSTFASYDIVPGLQNQAQEQPPLHVNGLPCYEKNMNPLPIAQENGEGG